MASSQILKLLAQQQVQNYLNQQAAQQFTPPEVSEDEIAKYQADFDAWKASQSKPKSTPKYESAEIPQLLPQFQGGYVSQNDARRSYKGNSALETLKANKEYLEGNNGAKNEPKEQIKQLDLSGYNFRTSPSEDFMNQVAQKEAEDKQREMDMAKARVLLNPSLKLNKQQEKAAEEFALNGLKKYRGMKKSEMTPEQLEEVALYKDLQTKTSEAQSFAIGAATQAEKIAKGIKKLGDLGFMGPAQMLANKVTQPLTDKIFNRLDDTQDVRQMVETQNPIATGAGKFATNAAAYAVTNPAFDAVAGALGAGGLGGFAINQAAQGAQDLALDILPTYEEMTKDGPITDDEIKELAKQFGWDMVGNLAIGVGGELIKKVSSLRQASKEAKAANDAFAEGVSKRADELAKLNEQGYVPPQRPTVEEIAALNTNPLEADNKQFNALMDQFNNEFKDDSAMRNIFTLEDLEASQNSQFTELMKQRPKTIADLSPDEIPEINTELPDIPSLKNVDDYSNMWKADNEIPNIADNAKLPESMPENARRISDEIDGGLWTAGKTMTDYQNSGYFDNVTDPKVLKAWERVQNAYSDYAFKLYETSNADELDKAAKELVSAKKSLSRALEPIDPKAAKDFNVYKENMAIKQPALKAQDPNWKSEFGEYDDSLGESFAEAEKDIGKSTHVQDAVPETQNPFKSVEADTTGPRPYAKNQSVSPSVENAAESLSKEMDNAAKTQQPRNFEIKELHDKKGRSRYQVVERISENMTKPVEAGKTYKTIDEANEAVYNLKNGNMNLQTFAGDASGAEPNLKVSETYTNTGKRGGGWTEAEYEAHTNPNNYLYETIDEAQSVERATQMRNTEGREAFKNRALYSDRLSSVELDGLMMEWRQLTEEARALEAAGKRADTKWLESNKIFRKIQEQSTDNAQALQALAKWSRNTPEGMLINAENIINGKAKANKGELQKAIDKLLKTNKGGVEFSPEFERDFIKTATPLMDLKGTELDGREAREIMAKLGKMVNEQIPVKWPEKLTTILMDNMLGNFRTLITRNAGGNVGLNAVEQTIQRPLAAGIDTLLSAKTGKRTQAGLSAAGLKEYIEGFTKGITDEVADMKTGLRTARSGENTLENAIKNNRRIFKSKVANGLDGLVKSGLSVGDRPFYEGVYKQTLGDYQRLRDRGLLGDAIQGLSDADFKEYAETAAKLNALGAVYQQDTVLSKALLEFKEAVGDLSRGTIGVDILSQFSMPFVKTPANVIERAIDYSPLGLVRNTFRTGKELSQGAFDQNRFANETARNILGTALMGGGVAMAANGGISGAYSDNKNEKQAQKESGMQEYAWNVPEEIPGIGGKQMDISWAPVVGSNLVAAAAAYDAYKNGEGDPINNLATGATAGGQALFNQSMFQGLQRLFGTGDSYNSDEGIVANMGNVVKSGVGQAIPSLVRQAAQVKDPYQRDLAYSNNGTTFGPFDAYDINSLANNVPGLREEYLAPKVDSRGNLMMENQGRSIPMKILEDMILPGKLTEVTESRLNEEAKRLSDITTNTSAYMPKADRQYIDTEEHTLTNEEWTEYRQRYGKEMTQAGETLLDSDFYKAADDGQKETYLKDVYSAVRSAINSEYTGKDVDGAAKAYKDAGGGEKGTQAVVNYIAAKDIISDAGLSSGSNAAKEIKEAANNGDMEKAQKLADNAAKTKEILDKYDISTSSNAGKDIKAAIEAGKPREAEMIAKKAKAEKEEKAKAEETKDTLSSYGLDKTGPTKTYEKAKSEIPSLTTQQFATTYKKIDSDGNQGIKQDEIIDYLNNNNVTEAEAQKIWSAYGNSSWKKIPVLKNGKWTKGDK